MPEIILKLLYVFLFACMCRRVVDGSHEGYAGGVGPSTCSAGDGVDASNGFDAANAENPLFALTVWVGIVILRTINAEI